MRWIGSLVLVVGLAFVEFPRTAMQEAPALISEASRAVRDSRGGERQSYRIVSSILKQTRRVNILLPASFSQTSSERRYPVAIVFDGEANVPAVAAVSDELARQGQIPEMIYVAIENTGPIAARVFDLTPPGLSVSGSDLNQGGDRFLDFIEQELLPAVDRQLRGSLPRVVIGHSSGAILATYAAATRDTFPNAIAIDGPVTLQGSWLAKKLTARARGSTAAPVRYMAYDVKFPWTDAAWNELTTAAPATWRLHRESMRLEAHETVVMISTYLGLREMFSDYSRLSGMTLSSTKRLAHYAAVSAAFGAPLVPPRRLLDDTIDDLLSEGRGAEAREAYAVLASAYGPPADHAARLAEIAEVERQPPPKETVEDLLKTPFPSEDEIRPFLGTWVGSIWMKPDQPRTNSVRLRIRVNNRRVIAETSFSDGPPELAGWTPVDYLQVTPQGLTWGRLNGMRPRGVMLWEGTLVGDTLAGRGRWGGIVLNDPAAGEPGFSFVRTKK